MAKHRFNYPEKLDKCHFCDNDQAEMLAGLYRLEDGSLTALFNLKCTNCGYTTPSREYPDSAVHVWNMASKIEVMRLLDRLAEFKSSE